MLNTILIAFSMLVFPANTPNSIYQFHFKSIDGKQIQFSEFKGKKILIVNTASKCGYTPQYEELEKLHQKYGNKLVIVGFPANNFGQQEPGSNAAIKEFCTQNYGVTFIMAQKVSVKGQDIDPLFKWLTEQTNPDFVGAVKWNFEKFLINEKGQLVHRFRSGVKPMSEALTDNL